MVKFAVCDDEPEMADYISYKLSEYYPNECDITTYTNGEDLLADSRRGSFDAFFLDIGMPGLDGMTLAGEIRKDDQNVKIIFVTNMHEFAYKGYIYRAFRYVRKSELEQELCEAARSLNKEFNLMDEYLIFKTTNGEIARFVKNIKYFEVEGHDVTIVCDESEERVYGTMNKYEERMKNMGFIRIHKSYLVNYRYIYSIEKVNVKLTCGTVLPLSRKRADEVRREFLELINGKKITDKINI